jgi:hypothetical protein
MMFRRCTISGIDYPHGSVEGQNAKAKAHRKNLKSNSKRQSSIRANHRQTQSTASRKSLTDLIRQNERVSRAISENHIQRIGSVGKGEVELAEEILNLELDEKLNRKISTTDFNIVSQRLLE